MDTEIKDILIQLVEKVTSIDNRVAGLETKVTSIDNKVAGLETKVTSIDNKVAGLETEVKKNSLKLEIIEKNINIIAEVQTAHKEQNIREFEKSSILLNEKTNLIETAVINTSKGLREVKESIDVLKDMTGRHEVDINILKRRPV